MVRLEALVKVSAEVTARSVIPPGGGGAAAEADLSVISIVMLELAAPLRVPWTAPVAPVAERTSCDISEVVVLLLLVPHTWVKPAGTFTDSCTTMPTM